jgi:hypothetical protein
MAKQPWFKFYPSDWRADPCLRMCSMGARGLWIEMLCLMHEAEPYGHLVVNGRPVKDAQIAALAGLPLVELGALLTELEEAGVLSRSRTGTIYSRRMTRDERKRKDGAKAAENGTLPTSRRGRQHTVNKGENSPPPGVAEGVVDKPPSPQKPEARYQTNKKGKETNVSSPQKDDPPHGGFSVGDLPEQPPTPPPKTDRASRLPTDWQPTADNCAYAAEKGFSPEQTADLAEGFRDYWCAKSGKDAMKTNWSLTWNTWVRNDIKFHGEPNARGFNGVRQNGNANHNGHAGTRKPSPQQVLLAAGAKVAARYRQREGVVSADGGRASAGDDQWPDAQILGPDDPGTWQ